MDWSNISSVQGPMRTKKWRCIRDNWCLVTLIRILWNLNKLMYPCTRVCAGVHLCAMCIIQFSFYTDNPGLLMFTEYPEPGAEEQPRRRGELWTEPGTINCVGSRVQAGGAGLGITGDLMSAINLSPSATRLPPGQGKQWLGHILLGTSDWWK